MSKELVKRNTSVSEVGEEIQNAIRDAWVKKEVERDVTELDKEGKLISVRKKFIIDSPIVRLNKGVNKETFLKFFEMVKATDKENILSIIKSGNFDVVKAIQAFKNGPLVAINKKIIVENWQQSIDLQTPSLVTLAKYKGNQKAKMIVFVMLKNYAAKFGKRNDLSEENLLSLAEDIMIEYPNVTIADLKLIFRKSLLKSNKLFNLDYQTVISLIGNMYNEKENFCGEIYRRNHREKTHEEKGVRSKKEATRSNLSIKDLNQIIEAKKHQK